MTETFWPAWYPGKLLSADDLLGLEDYLLARSNVTQRATGVESMGTDSVRPAVREGRLRLSVGDLRGITPRGQPVVLDGDAVLCDAGGERDARLFDISVCVNARGSSHGDGPRKLTPSVNAVAGEDEPFAGGFEELYLGRYSWDAEAGRVALVSRPAVTHLGALKGTEGWEQWTAPVRDRLSGLVARLEGGAKEATPRQSAALGLTYRVGFGWPHMPIDRLSFNLQAIRWLLVDTDPAVAGCDALLFPPESCDSEGLPMWLASHVDQARSDFPGHDLRPDRDVAVEFEPGNKVVYTFLQGLRPGRLELHMRRQGSGGDARARELWWKLDDEGGQPIDRRRHEEPQPSEGEALVYSVRFSQIPQAGYKLTVSGVSREAFDRTRLFFVQSQA